MNATAHYPDWYDSLIQRYAEWQEHHASPGALHVIRKLYEAGEQGVPYMAIVTTRGEEAWEQNGLALNGCLSTIARTLLHPLQVRPFWMHDAEGNYWLTPTARALLGPVMHDA